MNRELARALAYLFVLAVAILGVYQITERGNRRFLEAALANCEAAKADRIDSARAATAQAIYLQHVLAAQSVKADVKDAATKSLQLWSESANQQRRRLYDCKLLVYSHKKLIDRDALLEAQGLL